MTHTLKCWPTQFAALRGNLKSFEFRKDDRGFKYGDTLVLCEYNPTTEEFSGEQEVRQVTYVLKGPDFGLPKGYVIMSLE